MIFVGILFSVTSRENGIRSIQGLLIRLLSLVVHVHKVLENEPWYSKDVIEKSLAVYEEQKR